MPISPTNLTKHPITPINTNKYGVALWDDTVVAWDALLFYWDASEKVVNTQKHSAIISNQSKS